MKVFNMSEYQNNIEVTAQMVKTKTAYLTSDYLDGFFDVL